MPWAAFCGVRHSESDVYFVKSSTFGRGPPAHGVPGLEPWNENCDQHESLSRRSETAAINHFRSPGNLCVRRVSLCAMCKALFYLLSGNGHFCHARRCSSNDRGLVGNKLYGIPPARRSRLRSDGRRSILAETRFSIRRQAASRQASAKWRLSLSGAAGLYTRIDSPAAHLSALPVRLHCRWTQRTTCWRMSCGIAPTSTEIAAGPGHGPRSG